MCKVQITDPLDATLDSMSHHRYFALSHEDAELTPAEFAAGWHFCWEWDGLLIHPSHPEAACCTCTLTEEYPS